MANDFDLGPPFACVGLIATLLVACAGAPLHDVALASLLPVCLYLIGRRQSRTGDSATTLGILSLTTLLFGVGFAFIVMQGHTLDAVIEALSVGVVLGVALFLSLLVPIGTFLVASKRVRVARVGSIAARAERRFVWVVGILPIVWLTGGVASLALFFESPKGAWPLVLLVAISVQVAPFIADALTLRRIQRYQALTLLLPTLLVPMSYTARVDLGVGDELRGHVTTPGTYREAPRASLVLVGSVTHSRAAVRACMRSYADCLIALYAIPIGTATLAVFTALVIALSR